MSDEMNVYEGDFDFWADRLNIRCGGYSEAVDRQLHGAIKLIVEARVDGTTTYNDKLAEKLGITRDHAELIQYILASVTMPVPDGKHAQCECFTYGTSPRGLFVDDLDMARQLLMEFETPLKRWEA
ncbi:MAG: hypothetical protein JWN86_3257 [Planctomycetota bacterium]|nr:hypothetical protein [Planctomycetota bacterium]